jgi:enoyl-CoA hydratase
MMRRGLFSLINVLPVWWYAQVVNRFIRKVKAKMAEDQVLDPHIGTERRGSAMVITLNRPEALNALTLGMIRAIRHILAHCKEDEAVKVIVFKGAGGRAFCAGGDIKAVYHAGVGLTDPAEKAALARTYFADEYRMNRELFAYPKPIVAMMDGITMGGGFGVAGPCRYRVATENTAFAMPETGIGFFPDVGSMYYLTRVPDRMGHWLALTGQTINGANMMAYGLASHSMPSSKIEDCISKICESGRRSAIHSR